QLIVEHSQPPEPAGAERIGLEIEWLTYPAGDRGRRASPDQLAAALQALAADAPYGRVTFEPGGQVELSSAPAPTLAEAHAAVQAGAGAIRRALARAGCGIESAAFDAERPPQRVLDAPRYSAMEAYFDRRGDAGRQMMCNTASIQVNLDLGGPEAAARWRRAHALGPVLSAAFANSPLRMGRPTGFRSTRAAVWRAIDRTRTAPASGWGAGGDPAGDWAAYALAARVMLVRATPERFVALDRPLPFAGWIRQGHELGWPTADDLAYHLTTLFPPVRPKGWLEIRFIDALPDPWWRVASAVTAALVVDAEAAAAADRAVAATTTMGEVAAVSGLGHPGLARAARACFDAALAALPRLGADPATVDASAAYHDLFVARGRTPADDLLDQWCRRAPANRPAAPAALAPLAR
ncbi:MAG: glutamate-cysteine ligase family protein, partial [Acidimicrobiales bacterium]